MVLKSDPGDKRGAEGQVEESFVGDGENDKDWRKSEKHYDESVKIVILWLETVEKW